MSITKEHFASLIESAGLNIEATFVPFSQSRNKNEKHKSLNWRVTLKRNGRDVLTTDYSAGIAHCPAYKLSTKQAGGINSIMRHKMIDTETETGKTAEPGAMFCEGKPILPNTLNVIASLMIDAEAIDHARFEDWADEYGYDHDSRKAEAIYRECLTRALAIRAAVGDADFTAMREAARDL